MSTTRGKRAASSQPWLHQEHVEMQPFGTVLFEEPGALQHVGQLATDRFLAYLTRDDRHLRRWRVSNDVELRDDLR